VLVSASIRIAPAIDAGQASFYARLCRCQGEMCIGSWYMAEAILQNLIEDHDALARLIGQRVRYLGEEYEVTDLLPEEGLMILSADEGSDVQEDSYGRPHRLVPRRQNLKFRDAEGCPSSIWEELAFLDGPLLR